MAPVKISYVVSFSSQDPKYPVENLLCEDSLRPWLGCPQDRSRQLRVELQLERASPIGYVDVGNCGCAFLQIEVGRSSWPLDRPYLILVPSVALMTPADSKLDQNRCGVRMFKEADFLALAVGQKWDRLRLTCSQPFSKRSQFGLSFVRVRTPLDPQHPQPPSQQGLEDAEPADGPRCTNPALCRTFFPEPRSSSREEEQLKSRLRQLEPAASSPARLSRPARMVLSAARSRALRPRAGTGAPGGDPELPAEDLGAPAVPGSVQDVPAAPTRARRQPDSRQRAPNPAGRSLPAASRQSRSGGRARARSHRERRAGRGDSGGDSSGGETGVCPICSGRFSLDLLPVHASRCGEEDPDAAWPSSPLVGVSPDAWVFCPICELPFGAAEVERHASACGEQAGTPGTPSSSYRVG
ncbi:short transient receptor potential channel 2-like [Gymnogyps californianus]|uniref:short transient receptor potential channel 2-like n=1 Tax=Gymnogyps californianus TaxID=33616 RepID=UPI0021C8E0EF|nr:short transient receptor potential channel 2-like [Gymnogyps californianus]